MKNGSAVSRMRTAYVKQPAVCRQGCFIGLSGPLGRKAVGLLELRRVKNPISAVSARFYRVYLYTRRVLVHVVPRK
jgi:hypothetical protein